MVDQLVQCLTNDKYKGNMVVVVAGYARDIVELMESNPGLGSRFPETIHFQNFDVDDSCRLLESSLKNGCKTELTPEATASLSELLRPIVQVRHVFESCSGPLAFSLFWNRQIDATDMFGELVLHGLGTYTYVHFQTRDDLLISLCLSTNVWPVPGSLNRRYMSTNIEGISCRGVP